MLKLKPRKTVEDYMKLGEEMYMEVIDGEFFPLPHHTVSHQDVRQRIGGPLHAFLHSGSLGEMVFAPMDIYLPSGDIVKPDIVVVLSAHQGIIQDWVRGVPDLLIEVLAPEFEIRDCLVKRALYARNGVPEYWIVDPATRTVEVLILNGASYASHGYFEVADTLISPTIAGLALPLTEIFSAS